MKSKYYFYSFYFFCKKIYICKCKENNRFCFLTKTNNLDIIKFINNKNYLKNNNFLLQLFYNYNLLQLHKRKVNNETQNLKYLLNNSNNYYEIFEKYLVFIDYIIDYHSVDFAIELLEMNNDIDLIAIARAKLTKNKKI